MVEDSNMAMLFLADHPSLQPKKFLLLKRILRILKNFTYHSQSLTVVSQQARPSPC